MIENAIKYNLPEVWIKVTYAFGIKHKYFWGLKM